MFSHVKAAYSILTRRNRLLRARRRARSVSRHTFASGLRRWRAADAGSAVLHQTLTAANRRRQPGHAAAISPVLCRRISTPTATCSRSRPPGIRHPKPACPAHVKRVPRLRMCLARRHTSNPQQPRCRPCCSPAPPPATSLCLSRLLCGPGSNICWVCPFVLTDCRPPAVLISTRMEPVPCQLPWQSGP